MLLPLSEDTRAARPAVVNAVADAVSPPSADQTEPETDRREPETALRTHRRFDRAGRLFGEPGMARLMSARVLVVGVGGVGSFAAEALARSGVGTLALIDFDKVCVTNTNRQLHAMKGTVGRYKVDVMAERLRLIHPTGVVEAHREFYAAARSEALLGGQVDFVIDAIDNLTAKAHLVAACLQRGLPVVSSMGAAARLDPTALRVADLADTMKDPFARALRRILREHHGIDARAGHPIGATAVFSIEEPVAPLPLAYDGDEGFRCVCPGGKNGLNDCDNKNRIDGTAAFVTGAFGLTAASVVARALTGR